MALSQITITGRVPFPNDATCDASTVLFALSGFDTEGGDVTIPRAVEYDLVAGELPPGATLWPNAAGARGTLSRNRGKMCLIVTKHSECMSAESRHLRKHA